MKDGTIINTKNYIRNFKTVFTGDYKAAFAQEVVRLIELHIENVEERIEAANFLVEAYVLETGDRPDKLQLDLLASHLLYEALEGDTRADKITLEEYPILTQAQFDRREKERGEFYVDFNGESSDAFNFNITSVLGSDGKSHARPIRRHRRAYENDIVNQQAQLRNKEMKAQYKKDTSPGAITRYNLNDGQLDPSFVTSEGIVERYKDIVGR